MGDIVDDIVYGDLDDIPLSKRDDVDMRLAGGFTAI